MAFCPKCTGAMGPTELVCPHCRYDFPGEKNPHAGRTGLAYSVMADAALVVSMISAGLGSLLAGVAILFGLLSGELISSAIGLIAFFLQLGMLVVFVRVSNLSK